jgi:excisionase family DNA binding protein
MPHTDSTLVFSAREWGVIQLNKSPLDEVRLLTVAEVATIMRISKMSVYRLVHSGELEAIRVGRSFRITEATVNNYLRGQPVRIYLQDGSDPEPIERSVLDLLDAFGFAVDHIQEPVYGSWFREFFVRPKSSPASVPHLLAELAHGLEQRGLNRLQSQVDLNQAEAVSKLLGALDRESDAIMQVGSIMLVKVQNKIIVRSLTETELAHFNQNPALFHNPQGALRILQRDWAAESAIGEDWR